MPRPRSQPPAATRVGQTVRDFWPSAPAGYVLLGLLVVGIALRLVAIVSWRPTASTLDDGYQLYAETNPFTDPQHPAGYGLIIAGLGAVTREIAVPVLLQHLSGIASALLLFAATRRVSGSAWAGLLPAGIVLLNPDQIFLEHAIMSESWAVLATSVGLYAAVRAIDEAEPLWRWPLLTGAVLALAVTIRTAGLLTIPVVVLALLLSRPRPFRRWRSPLAAAGAAAVVLVVFAVANASFGARFGIGPSPGWYLYGRAAQFADCSRFTPPPGTEVLCDERPPAERPGASYYLFDPKAPAPRYIGSFGENDDLLGEWSKRAVRAQPGDFLSTAWGYLRAYWVPGLKPERASSGGELDPQLDFTLGIEGGFNAAIFKAGIEESLESYFNDFTIDEYRPGLEFLRGWHLFTRFGATALSIATLLTLLGLLIGSRRSRVGVLLFGIGGLALSVAPVLTGNYVGRYTVPMAGLMVAAAAIAIVALWHRFGGRPAGDVPAAESAAAPTT